MNFADMDLDSEMDRLALQHDKGVLHVQPEAPKELNAPPPHDLALEHDVASAVIRDHEAMALCMSLKVTSADFYDYRTYGLIFATACKVWKTKREYTIHDFLAQAKSDDVLDRLGQDLNRFIPDSKRVDVIIAEGGLGWASIRALAGARSKKLTDTEVTSLRDLGKRRAAIRKCQEQEQKLRHAKTCESAAVLADFSRAMTSKTYEEATLYSAKSAVDQMLFENAMSDEGILLDFPRLDKLAGPIFPGLTVIAGNTGVGKSALARTVTDKLTQDFHRKVAVLYFSLDERRGELVQKLIRSIAGVPSSVSPANFTSDDVLAIDRATNVVRGMPLYMDDRREPTIEAMEGTILAVKGALNHNQKLFVIVDSIQLIKVERGERDAAWQLSEMAHRHGVPIVATSSLVERYKSKKSQEGETLHHDAPQLADVPAPVREAASRVILIHNYAAIHRAEMFHDDDSMTAAPECVVIIVAKNKRGGGIGRLEFTFQPSLGIFSEVKKTQEPARTDDVADADAYDDDIPCDD